LEALEKRIRNGELIPKEQAGESVPKKKVKEDPNGKGKGKAKAAPKKSPTKRSGPGTGHDL